MVTGIWIALLVLIIGFFIGLGERNAENIYFTVISCAAIILGLTLSVTTAPKSTADELKDLQRYCIAIGVATMTPEVTVSKFSLLPPGHLPVLGEGYSIATGVVVLTPEFKGSINDK
jgi:hypothetical protein